MGRRTVDCGISRARSRRARATRVLWLVGTVAFAALGQGTWLLGGPPVDGLVWYVLAAICLLRASPPEISERPRRESCSLPSPHPDRRSLALLALGAAAIVMSIVRAGAAQSAGALLLPYLSGILLLLAAVMPAAALRWPWYPFPTRVGRRPPPWSALALAGVGLLALLLRFWRLDSLPLGLWYDEGNIGLEAARVLADQTFRPLYSHVTMTPAAYLYAIAGSLALFGQSVAALRLVSAGAGVLTVLAWYAFLREGFSTRVALAGALLMAVSRWDLTFSRLAFQGATTPLLEVTVLALLLAALRRGSLLLATGAGMVLGAGLGFYVAFLAFPVVIGGYLAYRILTEQGFWTRARTTIALFAVTALLAGLPVLAFAALQPETFWGRVVQTAALQQEGAPGLAASLAETVPKHLLMFQREGDHNGRHNLPGAPMLDPLTGMLMALGLGWSLRHPRQPFSVLGLLWLGVMLLPGIFSLPFEAPQGLRAIGALPAALLFATVGLDRLWRAAEILLDSTRRRRLVALVVGTLVLIAALNIDTYFRRQAQDYEAWAAHSTAEAIIGRRLAALPAGRDDLYLSGLYQNHPAIQFLAGTRPKVRTFVAAADLPLRSDREAVLLFLEPREDSAYALLRRYYPEASCTEVTVHPGVTPTLMYTCEVPGRQVQAVQGLQRLLTTRGSTVPDAGTPGAEAIEVHWGAGEPLAAPLEAAWTGALHAPESGSYRLRATGDAALGVTLDGTKVMDSPQRPEAQIDLAQGLHQLAVSATATASQGFLRLLWQPPGRDWEPLPAAQVFRGPVTAAGLTGSYYANPDWLGPPAFRRVDPGIALYFHLVPLPRPYSVEWTGSLLVTTPGRYQLGLRSISTASLTLEDTPVVEVTVPGQQREQEVSLAQGTYRLRLRFRDQQSYSHVYLMWAPPGGSLEPIPPEALRPW